MRNRLWQHIKDVRRVADHKANKILSNMPEADEKVSANVGELMAAALAAAGTLNIICGGSTPCETDYLAAQGATFPSVSREALEEFNRRTMFEAMDEAAEMRRYRMIAEFFG